jgi:hypothetical protein
MPDKLESFLLAFQCKYVQYSFPRSLYADSFILARGAGDRKSRQRLGIAARGPMKGSLFRCGLWLSPSSL